VSEQGGSILEWLWQGRAILGPARLIHHGKIDKERGVTHWCYPNFGIANPKTGWELPPHGNLRVTRLDVMSQSEKSVRFAHMAREPFVTVSVNQDGIRATLQVRNEVGEEIPILPAIHPYFSVPEQGLVATMAGKTIVDVNRRPFYGVSRIARVLERIGPVLIELIGLGQVELVLPDNCSHIVTWSDKPLEYVCVEPIFGKPGSFGTLRGRWLEPNDTYFCEVIFKMIPT
jgi:hypothetical protein